MANTATKATRKSKPKPKNQRHVPSKHSLARMVKEIGTRNNFTNNPTLISLRERESQAEKLYSDRYEKVQGDEMLLRLTKELKSARDRRRNYEDKLRTSMFADKKKIERLLELEGSTPRVCRLVKKYMAKYDPIIEE